MSDENSNAELQVQESVSSHEPDRITDTLWDQILQAGQEAREGATSVPVSPRASALPRHVPASLRYLAETAEHLESEVARLSRRGMSLAETAEQLEHQVARIALRSFGDGRDTLSAEPMLSRNESRAENMDRDGRVNNDERSTRDRELQLMSTRVAQDVGEVVRREQADSALRIAEENPRSIEGVRARMPHLSSNRPDPNDDENFRRFLDRTRRSSTLQHLERQQQAARVRELMEGRHTTPISSNIPEIAPAATNYFTTANSIPPNSDAVIERSTTARRDLERALRDYRIARRAFRTQHTSDSSPPAEQNMPSYQGVLAQLAEQQALNRNRLRVRGQSRSNALDLERSTDEVIDRVVNATNTANNTSQADRQRQNDRDFANLLWPSTNRDGNSSSSSSGEGMRSSLPAGVNVTNENYLVSPVRSSTAGMRDFYQRTLENQRNSGRSSFGGAPRVLPPTTGTSLEPAGIAGSSNPRRYTELRAEHAIARMTDSANELQGRGQEPPAYGAAKRKAMSMLQHLSNLKVLHNDHDRITVAVKNLDNDDVNHSLARGEEVDLPRHISELPVPPFSSWLEDGLSWEGFQKGGIAKKDDRLASGPLFDTSASIENRIQSFRAWRHREMVRAERQQRARSQAGQSDGPQASDGTRGLLRGIPNDMESLADIERHLTDLLEEEERRLTRGGATDHSWGLTRSWTTNRAEGLGSVSSQDRSGAAAVVEEKTEDRWPVKVTLYDVNWENKTVQGGMVATQILGQQNSSFASNDTSTIDTDDKKNDGTSMESLFNGEIIDFHTHELETVSGKTGYTVGGPMTDLKYWSRVGPFNEEINRRLVIAREKKAIETFQRLGIAGVPSQQYAEYERTFKGEHGPAGKISKEEEGVIVYDTMAEMLGSRKWLEKMMGEDGWVFMRWKEHCFVTEPGSQTPSSSSANDPLTRLSTDFDRPSAFTTAYTDDQHPSRAGWGLTIRGFYYVAMNRTSGKIDALYFDSGSHPFQQLACHPTGVRKGDDDIGPIRCDFGTYELR